MAKNVEPARQTDALAAPKAIFEEAKRRAARRNKIENLELLWSVLIEIREAGGRDYSLSEVGRRLQEKGGIKTQSLRNAGGVDFREVITAFAQSVMGSPRYIAKTKSSVDQALDFISDPSVRAVLKEEIARAKKLREENATLRHAFSRMSIPMSAEEGASETPVGNPATTQPDPSVPPESRSALGMAKEPTKGASLNAQPDPILSNEMLKALQKGVDRRRIQTLGFKALDDGSIVLARPGGGELFPPGFVTACEAVLASHRKEFY